MATSRRRAAGSSSASSGRRHGSRGPQTTRRSRSTASPADPCRRVPQLRPYAATSWTRTTRDCGRRWSSCVQADELGYDASRAELGALALGYWSILSGVHRAQHGAPATARLTSSFEQVAAAAADGGAPAGRARSHRTSARRLPRRAPLGRRARATSRTARALPAARPDRVRARREGRQGHARVRDPGGRDVPRRCRVRVPRRRAHAHGCERGCDEAARVGARRSRNRARRGIRGSAVASPDDVRSTTDEALGLIDRLYPRSWKEASKTADFDVIAATLDRLQAAVGDRGLEAGGDGAARGVRSLRARAGATSPRSGAVALPGGRGLLLVRGRRP